MSDRMPEATLNVGQRLSGCLVEAVTPLPEIRCMAYRLSHSASGAKLLHLHAGDSENLLALAFRTPPPDDTGLPHILEHTVLCGSRKYPVKDPFVELLKTSLATFLNAMTYPDKTVYPCASMNETDFFNLAGVYCDAVFNPRILPEHFKQEGHHYDFEVAGDTTTPLTIKGIVYNEMKGAFSDLDGTIDRHCHDVFPDNAYGRVSGGAPEAIPSLTYNQFVDFHRTYYHPSNAYIFLYGDIPTEKHAAFLETYLAAFPRIEIDTAIAEQPRWTEPRRMTFPYPATADDAPDGKTAVVLSFFTNPVTDALQTLALNVLDYYLLGNSASPLRKALIDSGLGEELTHSGYGDYQRDTTFMVGLKGTAPDKATAIEKLVLDTCRRLADEGLDGEKLTAALHRIELEARDIPTMYPLHLMGRAYDCWIYDADPLTLLQPGRSLDALRAQYAADPRLFEHTLRNAIVDNPHYAVMTFVPDPEIEARTQTALAEELAAVKDRMPPEELAAVAREAHDLDALQSSPNPPDALATLPRLALSDVSAEPMSLPTERLDVGGRPFLNTSVFANGLNHLQLALDLRGLDEELLPYLPLYTDALRKMGAAGLDYVRMAEREAENTGGIGVSVSARGRFDNADSVQPALIVSTRCTDARLAGMQDVVADRLLRPDFFDLDRLRTIVIQNRVHWHAELLPSGNRFALLYAQRALSRNAELTELFGGITQVRLADRLAEAAGRGELDDIVAKLGAIHAALMSRHRLAASFVGSDAAVEPTRAWVASLLESMNNTPVSDAGGGFEPRLGTREGIALPADVAFVAQAFRAVSAGHAAAPALMVIAQALSFDYLWNEVRAKRGAYGCRASYDQGAGMFRLSSYRDPFVMETLATYASICDYLERDMDRDPDAVQQAIIGSVKELDHPIRPGAAAGLALGRHLSGITEADRLAFRRRLLSLTPDDLLEAVATVLRPGFGDAPVCVVSSRRKLEAANLAAPGRELVIEDL